MKHHTARPATQVWFAEVDALPPRAIDLLNRQEQDRRHRFMVATDQARFVTAAVLLRMAMADELGVDPFSLFIERGCTECGQPHGRPRHPTSGLHLSVSHSAAVAAVAISRAAPIGIDVQRIGEYDTSRLATSVLAPGETCNGQHDFYRYWCRKEAVLKATGDGMRVSPARVCVGRADRPPVLASYDGNPMTCRLQDLTAPNGYAAAVAVLGSELEPVEVKDGTPLLVAAGRLATQQAELSAA